MKGAKKANLKLVSWHECMGACVIVWKSRANFLQNLICVFPQPYLCISWFGQIFGRNPSAQHGFAFKRLLYSEPGQDHLPPYLIIVRPKSWRVQRQLARIILFSLILKSESAFSAFVGLLVICIPEPGGSLMCFDFWYSLYLNTDEVYIVSLQKTPGCDNYTSMPYIQYPFTGWVWWLSREPKR